MNDIPATVPEPQGIDELKAALSLALHVDSRTLDATLSMAQDHGEDKALALYPAGTTIDTIRYVLDNRTTVDVGAYNNGFRNGVDEVAFSLGLPFHGAKGEHYEIDDIVNHVGHAHGSAVPPVDHRVETELDYLCAIAAEKSPKTTNRPRKAR